MNQLQKLEGQLQLNCSADKLFEMKMTKQSKIPIFCPNVCKVEALQGDWESIGSTRRWDYIIDGKSEYLIERIDTNDKKSKIIRRTAIDGDIMKSHYKTFASMMYVIPNGKANCVVKVRLEYEKIKEDVPEPHHLLRFGLIIFEALVSHLT